MKVFYKGVCTDLGDPVIDGKLVHFSWLSEVKAFTEIKANKPVNMNLKKFKGITTKSGIAFDKDRNTYVRFGLTNGPILCYKEIGDVEKEVEKKIDESKEGGKPDGE